MFEIRKTAVFEEWFTALRDRSVRVRVQARIDRLAAGNPGPHRVLTRGVVEMKIDLGPGWRVYFTQRGSTLVILLCGGSKGTQQQDIKTALAMAGQLE